MDFVPLGYVPLERAVYLIAISQDRKIWREAPDPDKTFYKRLGTTVHLWEMGFNEWNRVQSEVLFASYVKACDNLRQWLFSGQVKSCLFFPTGKPIPIPSTSWGTPDADEWFSGGCLIVGTPPESSHLEHKIPILVEKKDLGAFLDTILADLGRADGPATDESNSVTIDINAATERATRPPQDASSTTKITRRPRPPSLRNSVEQALLALYPNGEPADVDREQMIGRVRKHLNRAVSKPTLDRARGKIWPPASGSS